jgi:hypothetical protein
MPRPYKVYKIPTHSKEWYKFRLKGIGSSEIGQILYPEDKYSNLAKLFHEKVGIMDMPDIDNEPMFHGRNLEAYIARLWQYWWNGEYIENEKANKKIRKCHSLEGYCVNPDYPFFFSSPDRLINKGMPKLNGEELPNGGIVEIKNINEYAKSEWADKAEKKYIAQVHQQMLVMGLDYAEICPLFGGNNIRVYAIERSQEMIDKIIYHGYQFWEMHVKPAKILAEDYWHHIHRGELEKAERVAAEIDRYEPFPQGNDSYRIFINNKRTVEREYAPPPEGAQELAMQHRMIKDVLEKLIVKEKLMKNTLIKKINDERAEKFNFGDGTGYVSNKADKNGKISFLNKTKVEFDPEDIIEKIQIEINERS